MNDIYRRIEAIRADRTHGASELARQALEILRDAALISPATDVAKLAEEMNSYAGMLAKARPAMVAIGNCVRRFTAKLVTYSQTQPDLEALRALLVNTADQIIKDSSGAKKAAVRNAAAMIPHGSCLMTCSYSSTVIQVLQNVIHQGKQVCVQALESKYRAFRYGEALVAALASCGIESKLVPDAEIGTALSETDLVLFGADAILEDGFLVNGVPSLELARAAAQNSPPVPVYSVCESTKFCPGKALPHFEAGLDLVPVTLLAGIITENGLAGRTKSR